MDGRTVAPVSTAQQQEMPSVQMAASHHDDVAHDLGQGTIPAVGTAFDAEFMASRTGAMVVCLDGEYWLLEPRQGAPRWASPVSRFHWVRLA